MRDRSLELYIESDTSYFARCSDCENCGDKWLNPALAAQDAAQKGWTTIGTRLICPECRKGYNSGGNGGQYHVPSLPIRVSG